MIQALTVHIIVALVLTSGELIKCIATYTMRVYNTLY